MSPRSWSPLVATHLPVGLEWTPLDGRRGPLLRTHVRPVWSSLDRCGASGACPFDDAFDPASRAAGVLGGTFDVGAVFESPIEGIYQGFLVELGLVH